MTPPKVSALEEVKNESAKSVADAMTGGCVLPIEVNEVHYLCELSAKRGFENALSHLAAQVEEFDALAAEDYAVMNRLGSMEFSAPGVMKFKTHFTGGARWQFEQDRARVAHAFEIRDSAIRAFLEGEKTIQELTARLSTAERENEERRARWLNVYDELQDKLAAAEALALELTAKVNKRTQEKYDAQKRVSELSEMVLVHDKRATDHLREANTLRNALRYSIGEMESADHRVPAIKDFIEEFRGSK